MSKFLRKKETDALVARVLVFYRHSLKVSFKPFSHKAFLVPIYETIIKCDVSHHELMQDRNICCPKHKMQDQYILKML